jgi:hypothetical protein
MQGGAGRRWSPPATGSAASSAVMSLADEILQKTPNSIFHKAPDSDRD